MKFGMMTTASDGGNASDAENSAQLDAKGVILLSIACVGAFILLFINLVGIVFCRDFFRRRATKSQAILSVRRPFARTQRRQTAYENMTAYLDTLPCASAPIPCENCFKEYLRRQHLMCDPLLSNCSFGTHVTDRFPPKQPYCWGRSGSAPARCYSEVVTCACIDENEASQIGRGSRNRLCPGDIPHCVEMTPYRQRRKKEPKSLRAMTLNIIKGKRRRKETKKEYYD